MGDLENLRRQAASHSDQVQLEKKERERLALERVPGEVAEEIKTFWMPAIQWIIREGHPVKLVSNDDRKLAPGWFFGLGSTLVSPAQRWRCDKIYVDELGKQLGKPFSASAFEHTDEYGNRSTCTIVGW